MNNKNIQHPVLVYFFSYWEDVCSGVSSKQGLLKSFNPRVMIKEIFDEITLNKQANKANEALFKRTLGNYLKFDPASQKRLKLSLQMMLKEIDLSKCRPRYLPKLCLSVLKSFDDFTYFEDCIESLIDLIDSGQFGSAEKDNVKQIVNHLIVEFREIGYTDNEIRNFPRNVFSNIYIHPDGKSTYWDFPHSYTCDDWHSVDQLEKYKQTLEDYQSNLTEKDRIKALLTIAKKPKESIRYIFGVYGMDGTDEVEVSEVLFYSPANKRLLKNNDKMDPEGKDELFGKLLSDRPINASILVEAISEASGEIIARSKVEKSFALCRRIMNGKNRLWISKSHLALYEDGTLRAGSHHAYERSEDDFTNQFSLTVDKQLGLNKNLLSIENTKNIAEANGWGRRFNESCYWLRRAEESDSFVDKLLSYWICIETLCAKSEDESKNWFSTNDDQKETDIYLIKEVVGKMRAVGKCYEHGWLIHNQLSELVRPPFSRRNDFTIPQYLIDKAQLTSIKGQILYLRNLIDCSSEIKDVLPNGLLKEQVAELHSFYTDKKIALSILKGHLQTTQDELAFLYRMRNKIAHDGSSEHPLLPSLCKIAEEYALTLFNGIGNLVLESSEVELSSALISAVQKYDFMEIRLQTEEPINVFLNNNFS